MQDGQTVIARPGEVARRGPAGLEWPAAQRVLCSQLGTQVDAPGFRQRGRFCRLRRTGREIASGETYLSGGLAAPVTRQAVPALFESSPAGVATQLVRGELTRQLGLLFNGETPSALGVFLVVFQ